MRKTVAILAALTAVMMLTAAFCGCSKGSGSGESVDISSLDRIKVYKAPNEKKGELIASFKGSDNKAMSYASRIYAETKSESLKKKEDVSDAETIYFFRLLNYEEEGTPKDDNCFYMYILGDRAYCYYSKEQKLNGRPGYICGYTGIDSKDIENMINGADE